MPRQLLRCAARVVALLARHRLHLHRERLGSVVRVPGERTFIVFRETSSDNAGTAPEVTLAVWFHLRGTTPGARWRGWLFERESILNTLLYAGFDGYRTKLWMIDPVTADYAGLYAWRGVEAAERYAHYITAVLRPLSTPGSVGCQILDEPLARYLARTLLPLTRGDPTVSSADPFPREGAGPPPPQATGDRRDQGRDGATSR